MQEFKISLDKLLFDNLYCRIDIFPLIESYNDGKSQIKSSIRNIISSYKENGLIAMDDESYTNLIWNPPTDKKNPDREIFVISNDKFEQQYKEHNRPSSQSITNNIINADNNSGSILQSSFLSGNFNPPIDTSPTEAKTNDNKKLKWLKQIWELISNNKLISGIILAIVLYLIFGRH